MIKCRLIKIAIAILNLIRCLPGTHSFGVLLQVSWFYLYQPPLYFKYIQSAASTVTFCFALNFDFHTPCSLSVEWAPLQFITEAGLFFLHVNKNQRGYIFPYIQLRNWALVLSFVAMPHDRMILSIGLSYQLL